MATVGTPRLDLIKNAFAERLLVKDIAVLVREEGYEISDRHLQRTFANLKRRTFSDICDVVAFNNQCAGRQ